MPDLSPSPTFLDVQGVRTRHVQAGSGPPVVLLHGIGRSLEDWADTLPALAPGFTVYAPDLIGFGLTDKPDVPYTLNGLGRFVRAYLDAVLPEAGDETRPVTLVGNSLGGAVAQAFARLYPGRTAGLVLVSSAGFGPQVTLPLRLLTVPRLGERLARPFPSRSRRIVQSLFHDPAFVTPERVALVQSLSTLPGAERALVRVARDLGTWRGILPAWRGALIGDLAPAQIPTLLVWGENDQVLPAHHLEAARRAYPHARWHLYPQTGHAPQTERAEEFNALLLEFLNADEIMK